MFRFTLRAQLAPISINGLRSFSASAPFLAETKPRTLDPRWLTLIKRRIGKCMMFGLKPDQVDEGAQILSQLAKEWRELIAGSEGFLTEAKRRSLFRHGVVWGEQDVMYFQGHVNNVTYVRYAETARVNWTRNIGTHFDPSNKKEWHNMVGSTGIGLILKSIKVDYKFPMTSPDKITVYQRLIPDPAGHLSSQSAFRLEVMILSEARQRPSARCFEDIVLYDYKKNRKTVDLPPFVLDQFNVMWKAQQQETEKWRQRISDIENRVRTLEVESWDRSDAVEDNGSA